MIYAEAEKIFFASAFFVEKLLDKSGFDVV